MFAWSSTKQNCLATNYQRFSKRKQLTKKKPQQRKFTSLDGYITIGKMSGKTSTDALPILQLGDKEEKKDTPYRLRKHSYREAVQESQQIKFTGDTVCEPISENNEEEGTTPVEGDRGLVDTHSGDEMGSIEDLLPPKWLLKKEEFEKKSTSNKLDGVFDAVNKLYNMYTQVNAKLGPLNYAVFDTDDGILPQLKAIAENARDSNKTTDILAAEVRDLREELDITKGLLQKKKQTNKCVEGQTNRPYLKIHGRQYYHQRIKR